jgi:uncharacterized protein YqeY
MFDATTDVIMEIFAKQDGLYEITKQDAVIIARYIDEGKSDDELRKMLPGEIVDVISAATELGGRLSNAGTNYA